MVDFVLEDDCSETADSVSFYMNLLALVLRNVSVFDDYLLTAKDVAPAVWNRKATFGTIGQRVRCP